MPIKYFDFLCENGHTFEGSFASLEEMDRQLTQQLVRCPICDSPDVRRLPSAAHIAEGGQAEAAREAERREKIEQAVERIMTEVRKAADRAEDVGENFVEESRRMQSGQAQRRLIKGKCTIGEARQLRQEGIDVLPVSESSGKTLN